MPDESRLHVAVIPAGEFVMGSDGDVEDEKPSHKAYVDEFSIGIYPVTNAEYAQFVRDAGHPSPAVRALPLMVSGAHEADFRTIAARYFWIDDAPPPERERHPVTLVSIDNARA